MLSSLLRHDAELVHEAEHGIARQGVAPLLVAALRIDVVLNVGELAENVEPFEARRQPSLEEGARKACVPHEVVGVHGRVAIASAREHLHVGGEPEVQGHGWFKVDNFTLFYDSEEIPTAIDNVKTSGAATTIASRQFFTVDGAQVAAPQKGISIVKNIMSDGTVKVSKIIIK